MPLASGGGRSTRMQIGISKSYWTNSVPFGAQTAKTPDWQIDSTLIPIECTTWGQRLSHSERIKRDVLDSSFWHGCVTSRHGSRADGYRRPRRCRGIWTRCRTYAEDMALTASQRANSSSTVFQMLHRHWKAGNQRVFALMKDVVTMLFPRRRQAFPCECWQSFGGCSKFVKQAMVQYAFSP